QLLDDAERRVFRAVSVFPGPFTLDAAQAVAGTQAGQAVLRLVDCSLVQPPQTGPDDRARYGMLETLRAYGAGLLAEAGEEDEVSAALAEYAAEMAGEALAEVYTRTRELDGLRHLDAEDATLRHALAWALEHDPETAVRLALALAPWWGIRGRLANQAPLLTAVAELADAGSDEWCAAHMFLAQVAGLTEDPPAALHHLTAARDALQDTSRSDDAVGPWLLSMCLGGRSSALIRLDRVAEAIEDSRRALDLAREIGIGGLEAMALACLSLAVWYDGDRDGALRLARQALAIAEEFAGSLQRGLSQIVTGILTEAGDLAAAEQACTAALASCRNVGDLTNLCGALWHRTILDLRTGRIDDAPAHLRELFQIATQTGLRPLLPAGLDCCGHLCAATGRPAEAITVWAAMSALASPWPMHGGLNPERREELRRQAREQLGPARTRAAEERGAAMSLATATEYAVLLAAEPARPSGDRASAAGHGAALLGDGGSLLSDAGSLLGDAGSLLGEAGLRTGLTADGVALARLSPRERELVTLVARGHTDAQIAGQLYITVRTVSSHLDRIRDKTGCRRRAELTRLALGAGLV
ncbi:MAG TPA: LuxR C-terminal-related transcriptional regulator, partial [Streptosporangiaceae bacterium]|nr:LuxR C-terminal-related transcriptional regulator [Streptosporangiaceae bacterium]